MAGFERRRGPLGWVRWLGVRLIVLAAVGVIVLIGYHAGRGATLSSAVRMLGDDVRLAAACPTEADRIRAFVARPVAEDGSYTPMSESHGEGWRRQVCDGSLVLREPPASAAAPTPVPTPNLQPQVEAAIEEALGTPEADATPAATPATSAPADATPIATATATATATPTRSAVADATPTPTATATPTRVGEDVATPPADSPSQRHIELKRFMLELINAERLAAGLQSVVLGENAAAQLHAEASLDGCFLSHWGADGLKPYMRYSLAGGYQSNGENGSGRDYCITDADNYRAIESPEQEVREAMEGWMESPGHRRNVLDPWHKAVNIGLAWDRYNFVAYQHFEGGYVEYGRLPAIENGHLILEGAAINGADVDGDRALSIQVYYDPPPKPLTRGQLARTYCYRAGLPVAALRRPPGPLRYYTEHEYTSSYTPCPNPYNAPADAPAPRSVDEAHAFWQAAYDVSQNAEEHEVTVPWITARDWDIDGRGFSVKADLSDVLAIYGPGVYSIIVWGMIADEDVVISEYSIFHEIEPPAGYGAARGR